MKYEFEFEFTAEWRTRTSTQFSWAGIRMNDSILITLSKQLKMNFQNSIWPHGAVAMRVAVATNIHLSLFYFQYFWTHWQSETVKSERKMFTLCILAHIDESFNFDLLNFPQPRNVSEGLKKPRCAKMKKIVCFTKIQILFLF